jgi:hypothetical protein
MDDSKKSLASIIYSICNRQLPSGSTLSVVSELFQELDKLKLKRFANYCNSYVVLLSDVQRFPLHPHHRPLLCPLQSQQVVRAGNSYCGEEVVIYV